MEEAFLFSPCRGDIKRTSQQLQSLVYDYITKLCRQQAEVIQNHDNENIRNIGQGEARHRKYRRLKLGGGQAYDRSSDYTAVVAGATNDRARSAVLIPG
jgi:hypothetical protein